MAVWNNAVWNAGNLWSVVSPPAPVQNKQTKNRHNTMKRQRFYPSRQANEPEWLGNYALCVLKFGPTLGLSALAIAATVADALYLKYVIGEWLPAVREFGPGCTQAVQSLAGGVPGGPFVLPGFTAPPLPGGDPTATPPIPATVPVAAGALDRIFAMVQEIKAKPALTPEMALQMGIVGSEDTPPPSDARPRFKVEVLRGTEHEVARLTFFKDGHMGMWVECRRGNGNWEFLAIDTESPYLDERPLLNPTQPETREYRLRFWDDGLPNGEWSDVAKVTVSP